MTPGERWNTGGVFQTYSAAGMMSITTPWRRRRTRRRSRGRAACGRRLGARLTEARNLHRAAGRLRLAFFQVLRRALDYGGPLDRTGNGCSIWSVVWPELFGPGGVWAGTRKLANAFESDRTVATAEDTGWRVQLMYHPAWKHTQPREAWRRIVKDLRREGRAAGAAV